jgi:hypothetical protein
MENKYDDEEIEEMVELIDDYDVEYDNCERIGCSECSYLEDCYHVAIKRQDSEWVKLINYGGYDTEEEFWEELLG